MTTKPAAEPKSDKRAYKPVKLVDSERKRVLNAFEAKTFYSPDGCWYWTGTASADGYGRMIIYGTGRFTHRLSFALFKGDVPAGVLFCHSCDNRLCINPDHLWIGSDKDNVQDMHRKGRFVPRNGLKILPPDVQTIRLNVAKGVPLNVVARQFNVSTQLVWNILNGKSWKKVPIDQDAIKNVKHDYKPGPDEIPPRSKFSSNDAAFIREMRADGFANAELGRLFNVDASVISNMVNKHTYK